MSTKSSAGQRGEDGGVWLAAYLKNIGAAVFIIVVVAFCFGTDLLLGPQFMFAYLDTQGGGEATEISDAVPWAFSAATTGMQYLIARQIRLRPNTTNDKLVLAVAGLLAVGDTAIDVGGFTAIFYGPEVGMQIKPDDPSLGWWIGAAIVVLVCAAHEYLLIKFLEDKSEQAKERSMRTPGAFIVDGVVWLFEWLFGTSRGLFIFASVLAVGFLDFWLGPEFLFNITTDDPVNFAEGWLPIIPLVLSGTTSGILVLCHRRLRDVDADTGWRFKLFVLIFVLLDGWVDLAGFTAFMHGPDEITLMPEDAGIAWLLLLVLVGCLCTLGEWLFATLLGSRDENTGQFRMPRFGRKNREMPEPSMGGMPGGGMASGF